MNLKALVLIALSVPFIASADSSCYTTKTPIIRYQFTTYYLPATICLENISESTTSNVLNVESSDETFPKQLKITELKIHNEDRYSFSAENVLIDVAYSGGCGSFEKAVLTVEGESESTRISTADLKVSLHVNRQKDSCHSPERVDVATYELVK